MSPRKVLNYEIPPAAAAGITMLILAFLITSARGDEPRKPLVIQVPLRLSVEPDIQITVRPRVTVYLQDAQVQVIRNHEGPLPGPKPVKSPGLFDTYFTRDELRSIERYNERIRSRRAGGYPWDL